MKSLLEVLSLSTDYLRKKGIAHPRREAEDLLCDLFGISRLNLYLEFERPLNEEEISLCRSRLTRRGQGEPSQYVHGQVDFYGCSFLITPAVLIPRQETEILVDIVAKELDKLDLTGKSLWDVCCGSGCIGIALKKRFPELQVTLSDISKDALSIAQHNAEKNHVDVRFLEGDLLTPFQHEKTHFLVCNPPYISNKEYEELEKEVHFEPKMALVSGENGTEIYERLAKEIILYLQPSALIWFEIGHQQGNLVLQYFKNQSWKKKYIEKDWAGHDRFFFLENE